MDLHVLVDHDIMLSCKKCGGPHFFFLPQEKNELGFSSKSRIAVHYAKCKLKKYNSGN